LRAYLSIDDGNMVQSAATRANTPAKQTAVIRKKCTPARAA
jgi:hypothetical protein